MFSRPGPGEWLDEIAVQELLGSFEHASLGIAVIDRDLRYVHVNPALAAMNRLSVEDQVGRPVSDVLPESWKAVEPLMRRALAGEPVLDVEVVVEQGAGERRFVSNYLPLGSGDTPAGVLAVVARVDSGDGREVLRVARERLELTLEGTQTGTFEWHAESGQLRWSDNLGSIWGHERGWVPESFDEIADTMLEEDRATIRALNERAFESGEGYEVEFRVRWPEGPIRWMQTRTDVIDGPDGKVLTGFIIDITQRKEREQAGAFLAQVSLALAESLDPETTLRRITELAVPELGDWCAVHLTGEEGRPRRLAVSHVEPYKAELVTMLQERYPEDPHARTGVPEVLRTGRSELYPYVSDELLAASARDEEHLELIRRLALHSAMVVPISARGRTFGAITFVYADSRRVYSTEDLELAEELGRRAGLAVDNARLHEAEREARTRLEQLQAVTDVGLTHLDLDDLLQELLRRVRDLSNADFAVVLLLDEQRQTLRVRAALGLEEDLTAPVAVPLGKGIAGKIAATGEPEIIEELRERQGISIYLRERARSLAGVPLRVDEVIGVMHVSSETPGHFTQADLELLQLVGDRAARAISHAALYERTRDIALTLQQSLLPDAIAVPPGVEAAARYLPGTEGVYVGGDWYDLFDLEDGRLAIVIGDVGGHGPEAAATMGTLRATLRAYLHQTRDPAAALELVDELFAHSAAEVFATVAVVVIDPGTGEGSGALAGHPPPLVRKADQTCEPIELPRTPPLGVPGVDRVAAPLTLPAGCELLLYTDGLVEVPGLPLNERLGALEKALCAATGDLDSVADEVLDAMLSSEVRADDVALLVLRRSADQP